MRIPLPIRPAALVLAIALCALFSCEKRVAAFHPSRIDRAVGVSRYPLASDPQLVGTYPGLTKSGAGYFYDDVLEYRVWMHPERGAPPLAGNEDYFAAFARYEPAAAFASKTRGAETPLVLVRQKESIDEPARGEFVWVRTERITEWQVEWLPGSHREPDSIERFLRTHTRKK